ncbi:hypothetical protein JYU34_011708 [Plutella xylostella]|uniref:Selenoprotein O n=1 Tax=Plutella xylostella TaxID=51655 RepID=A0ABQ7QDF6_PLUXY|nr:hypothetical protein JYU34_011708 [Plutella xylostella]
MKRTLSICTVLLKDLRRTMGSTENVNLTTNFKEWKFKSPPNYAQLPINDNPEYNVPVAVNNAVFSKVPTEGLTGNLRLVCSSDDALSEVLDLHPAVAEDPDFIDFVAGKYLPDGGMSVCHRYGGYQFGFWADQLGDGRAHILGEYVNRKSESWQPQLKGSGETPYSRFGDGRAVLRSSVREMIASEACHALGVPTTRAGALVVSDDHLVYRDMHYSGRARQERAAAVLRLAPAWYRLGSLEILHKRKEPELAGRLADFIIENHFKEIDLAEEDRYVKWFSAVAHKNLDMVATWQGTGFTHGVLNTDNVSVLGLTIDYGPYGFMDHYNEHFVPNSSDDMGRYAFNRQPGIIIWNLNKFSEALAPILTENQIQKIEEIKGTLEEYVKNKVLATYLRKLGLNNQIEGDTELVDSLLQLMQDTSADFTMTFRQLGELESAELQDTARLNEKWSLKKLATSGDKWAAWVKRYQDRINKESVPESERRARMCRVNPLYVPRNWLMQEAIADAEKNDFEKVRFLLQVLRKPYDVNAEAEARGYSAEPPSWAYGIKLSCSS